MLFSFSAVALGAYCLATVSLGKDIVDRSKRDADSLYDNIYSAISEFSGKRGEKSLEELSKELPEQARAIRQTGGFNQGFQQQQLPRAGKAVEGVKGDCDSDEEHRQWHQNRRRRGRLRRTKRSLFQRLLSFLGGGEKTPPPSTDRRKGTAESIDASPRPKRKPALTATTAGPQLPPSTQPPIHREVVNPANPFLRPVVTAAPPDAVSVAGVAAVAAVPAHSVPFSPSQVLLTRTSTTPTTTTTTSRPPPLDQPQHRELLWSTSPRATVSSSSPSSSLSVSLSSFSPSPRPPPSSLPFLSSSKPPPSPPPTPPSFPPPSPSLPPPSSLPVLPPVTSFSQIFTSTPRRRPATTPRSRPKKKKKKRPPPKPRQQRPNIPSFTDFRFDFEPQRRDEDAETILSFNQALLPLLGRQRQVVVDGFPAGLPEGTPQGVRIALASSREFVALITSIDISISVPKRLFENFTQRTTEVSLNFFFEKYDSHFKFKIFVPVFTASLYEFI